MEKKIKDYLMDEYSVILTSDYNEDLSSDCKLYATETYDGYEIYQLTDKKGNLYNGSSSQDIAYYKEGASDLVMETIRDGDAYQIYIDDESVYQYVIYELEEEIEAKLEEI